MSIYELGNISYSTLVFRLHVRKIYFLKVIVNNLVGFIIPWFAATKLQ